MHWYEDEVKELEKKIQSGENKSGVNLFYGSSSFRLWKSLNEDLKDYEIVNNAFGGSTLEACAYFFERLVVPMKAKTITLYAGDNDLGDGKSPALVKGYFDRFYYKLRHYYPNTPFTFVSIKPSPHRWHLKESIEEVNGYIQLQLENRPNCNFVDVYYDMCKDGKVDESLFAEDKLHMTNKGYEIWTKKLNENGSFFK